MKHVLSAAMAALLASGAASAQEDPVAVKAQADAQAAQIAVIKSQLDLQTAVRGAFPSNTSAITNGEKTAEAQILKYAAYRAAAAQLVAELKVSEWLTAGSEPYVIVGSAPPSLALLSAYRSELETVRAALIRASHVWRATPKTKPAPGKTTFHASLMLAGGPVAAVGLIANVASLLAPSSSVTGAQVTADNALVATFVAEALERTSTKPLNLYSPENLTALKIGHGGAATANALLAPLATEHARTLHDYEDEYLKTFAGKSIGDDAVDAALKAAGTNLQTALAAYDALHAKLLADVNGVELSVAIDRLQTLESKSVALPLLYVLGTEASVSVETLKGPAHWFDAHPFAMRAVVSLNYAFVEGSKSDDPGVRGTVSCVLSASKFRRLGEEATAALSEAKCGTDITPRSSQPAGKAGGSVKTESN